MGKKGSEKYYIIISLILGIMVLALALYFIFHEYFTEEDMDWEACRQSLVLRNSMPEKDLIATISAKGLFTLKCKTNVLTIDYEDVVKAEKEIAETIGSCWYIVGQGYFKVFPGSSSVLVRADTPCMVCARIHLDSGVADFYNGENRINLERAVNSNFKDGKSFWEYLNPPQGPKAFMYFKSWHDGGFWVDQVSEWTWKGLPNDVESFHLPKYFYVNKGDLFVVYAEPVTEASFSDERGVKPYMILLQKDEFDKLGDVWVKYELSLQSKVCSSIESIPA